MVLAFADIRARASKDPKRGEFLDRSRERSRFELLSRRCRTTSQFWLPGTDGIMPAVKNDGVIGDNMGFPGDGLTSHSGFRWKGDADAARAGTRDRKTGNGTMITGAGS